MPTSILNPSKNKVREDRCSSAILCFPEISDKRRTVLLNFQRQAEIRFKNINLLNVAFIHRSAANEYSFKCNNERLEFLGDAILGAVTATLLYELLADRPEGDLAKVKSVVVSEEILAGIALELQIDNLIILGKGEELSGGRTKKAILADTLEALIGAYYLDSGFKTVFKFVKKYIQEEIRDVIENSNHKDYKTLLQELTQHMYRSYPVYRLVKKTGPDHDRTFWIEVLVGEKIFGPAIGKNKKEAEQAAAQRAYEAITGSMNF